MSETLGGKVKEFIRRNITGGTAKTKSGMEDSTFVFRREKDPAAKEEALVKGRSAFGRGYGVQMEDDKIEREEG